MDIDIVVPNSRRDLYRRSDRKRTSDRIVTHAPLEYAARIGKDDGVVAVTTEHSDTARVGTERVIASSTINRCSTGARGKIIVFRAADQVFKCTIQRQCTARKNRLCETSVVAEVERHAILSRGEINRVIATCGVVQDNGTEVHLVVVGVDATRHGVVTAADKAIVTVSTDEHIGAWTCDENVIAASTDQSVITVASIEQHSPRCCRCSDGVIPRSPEDGDLVVESRVNLNIVVSVRAKIKNLIVGPSNNV